MLNNLFCIPQFQINETIYIGTNIKLRQIYNNMEDEEYSDPNQVYYGIVERCDFAPMTDSKWKQLKRYFDKSLDEAIHTCEDIVDVRWTGGDVLSESERGEVQEEDDYICKEPEAKKPKGKTQQEIYSMLFQVVAG
jgi:hypothetical protein